MTGAATVVVVVDALLSMFDDMFNLLSTELVVVVVAGVMLDGKLITGLLLSSFGCSFGPEMIGFGEIVDEV